MILSRKKMQPKTKLPQPKRKNMQPKRKHTQSIRQNYDNNETILGKPSLRQNQQNKIICRILSGIRVEV
jgi:hypothetical protein